MSNEEYGAKFEVLIDKFSRKDDYIKGGIIYLLVEIESFGGDKLLSGKKCSKSELRQKMNQILNLTGSEEFVEVFCRLFQFEEYSLLETDKVDFIMDLDTCMIYKPKYDIAK